MPSPDTPPASVANIAHAGERLRLELLDALRRAQGSREKAAVVTEMVMLYGQAFRNVYDACIDETPGRPMAAKALTIKALHECVCGLAVYKLWLASETPVDARVDCDRMTAHWGKVTGMVLGEE